MKTFFPRSILAAVLVPLALTAQVTALRVGSLSAGVTKVIRTSCASMIRRVAAASPSSDTVGFCTTLTWWPSCLSRS